MITSIGETKNSISTYTNIIGSKGVTRALNSFRIVYVADCGDEGSFSWFVNGQKSEISQGDIMLFNPTDIRFPQFKHRHLSVRAMVIDIPPETLLPNIELIGLFYGKKRSYRVPAELAFPIVPLIERLFEETDTHDIFFDVTSTSIIRLILVDLLRIGQENGIGPTGRSTLDHIRLMGKISIYIHENISGHITIKDTAQHFGISESLLSKLFANMYAMTFPEYIRRLRINNTIEMLLLNDMGILEAAYESGFSSAAGFYKSFRSVTGMAPGNYLRMIKNAEK